MATILTVLKLTWRVHRHWDGHGAHSAPLPRTDSIRNVFFKNVQGSVLYITVISRLVSLWAESNSEVSSWLWRADYTGNSTLSLNSTCSQCRKAERYIEIHTYDLFWKLRTAPRLPPPTVWLPGQGSWRCLQGPPAPLQPTPFSLIQPQLQFLLEMWRAVKGTGELQHPEQSISGLSEWINALLTLAQL